jgi:hypothetical protein
MIQQDGELEISLFGEPEPPEGPEEQGSTYTEAFRLENQDSDNDSEISDTPPAVSLGSHPSGIATIPTFADGEPIYPRWYQGATLQTNLVSNYNSALEGARSPQLLRLEADFSEPSLNTVVPSRVRHLERQATDQTVQHDFDHTVQQFTAITAGLLRQELSELNKRGTQAAITWKRST